MIFTITVEVTYNEPSHAVLSDAPHYKVFVNPSELVEHSIPGKPVHIAAHEVGHVLAHAFNLPFNGPWNKPGTTDKYSFEEDYRMGVENEAWDLAGMMATKSAGLATHKKDFQPPPSWHQWQFHSIERKRGEHED